MTPEIHFTEELHRFQDNESKDQLRVEELKKTIPDLAEDKFNALPMIYTKPEYHFQSANIEDAVQDIKTSEWQVIARCLRDKNTTLAGELLRVALKRVCLEQATEEIEDKI